MNAIAGPANTWTIRVFRSVHRRRPMAMTPPQAAHRITAETITLAHAIVVVHRQLVSGRLRRRLETALTFDNSIFMELRKRIA